LRKSIIIICNLDTRGEDILFVKDLIRARGHEPILVDFSMEAPPPLPGDFTCDEVALRGGMSIEAVRSAYSKNREAATSNQIAGVAAIVSDLKSQGRVHGVIGIGGATSALVATAVMQRLPFGLPKLMASPVAAHPRYVGRFVGTRDIVMHNTVLDIVKMNPLLKAQIINAVGAICGMVEMSGGGNFHFGGPAVAVSSFGFAEMAVQAALTMLEEAGFSPVVFHAQGVGDRAMEEMIGDGLFQGVLDICTGGIVENLYACGKLDVADVERVTDHHVGDIDLDVIGDVRRIDLDLELAERLVENSTLEPHAFRDSAEDDRYVDDDLLAGDERLEIDVKDLALDRMALDLTNERLRSLSTDRHFDDGALGLDVPEHLVEITRVQRERLRIASVAVDHRGDLSLAAKRAGGTLS